MDKEREIQVIDRSDDFDRTETFQKKVADKNKINLAELILNATNRQIEDKKTVEAKATGYLAFAALILAIIAQLFPDVINTAKENNCLLFTVWKFNICSLYTDFCCRHRIDNYLCINFASKRDFILSTGFINGLVSENSRERKV